MCVQCSTECGRGLRTREVVCVNVNEEQIAENLCVGPKPRQTQLCDMGSCARTWFYTTWSQQVRIKPNSITLASSELARWCNGKAFGLAISRSQVQILLEATLRNNLGQVVHTYVSLSPSSITS